MSINLKKEKKDLLIWLKNFYDYDFIDNKERQPSYITITEIYGEYKPLPRKHAQVTDLTKQKVKDYVKPALINTEKQMKKLCGNGVIIN